MPINSPDIFDSIGDAVVTGAGFDTFEGLSDTPANYTGSADKLVAVNAEADALVFVNKTFFINLGQNKTSTTEVLLPSNQSDTILYTSDTVFLMPEKCEVVSVQILTKDAIGATTFAVLNVAKSDLGTSSSGVIPLESATLVNGLAGATNTLNFTSASSFLKNEVFALRWNPTTAPSYTIATVTFKVVP